MPIINEVKCGREIDRKLLAGKFIWHTCVDCGKGRWVRLLKNKPVSLRCRSCHNLRCFRGHFGERNPSWKGGRVQASGGYILRGLQPNDFFYPMAGKDGYVLEHRLVMAKYLGRCLLSWEVVHHKNGIKDDNRLENLELLPHNRFHQPDMRLKARIKQLEKRVTLLEAENILLKNATS